MRFYLGITLLIGVVLMGLVSAWEWLVKLMEPSADKQESLKTHWLLWQSGIVRRGK